MTNDGRDFAKLTEKEVDGLSDPEFDRYGKWKKSKLIEVEQRLAENKEKLIEVEQRLAEAIALRIKAAKEADESGERAIKAAKEADESGKKLIAQYNIMLANFVKLYEQGSKSEVYVEMKNILKTVILAGKPPVIIAQIDKMNLRAIIMDDSAQSK